MHVPWDMHPPLGRLKQSPELLRHCISCACPKTWSAMLEAPCGPAPIQNGPTPHTGSPASIQAAGAPSHATGQACCCIHTHVWPCKTTQPFCSLSMSGNDSAHSKQCVITTGDTQEVPRAHQALHKPHLPFVRYRISYFKNIYA